MKKTNLTKRELLLVAKANAKLQAKQDFFKRFYQNLQVAK